MGIFDKLSSWLKQTSQARREADFIPFQIKCEKCGEEITIMVNRRTDFQNLYLEPGEQGQGHRNRAEVQSGNPGGNRPPAAAGYPHPDAAFGRG